MAGKSEYPRVEHCQRCCCRWDRALCEICGMPIAVGESYKVANIRAGQHDAKCVCVQMCDTCSGGHTKDEILNWWLKRKQGD